MNPKLQDKIDDAVANETPERLALGWVRYEALRRASPNEFHATWHSAMVRGLPFDQLVDELACQDVTRGGAM